MKTIFILAIMLFIYPWSNSNSSSDNLLFEGMYTITGRAYNELQQYASPAGCQAIYVKIYEQKLVTTFSVYGTVEYQDVEYRFYNINKEDNHVYSKDNIDAFVVDKKHNLQRIMSTYTYNGNKRIDYCEVVKGDYSADCLKRMEDAIQWERMKSTMD